VPTLHTEAACASGGIAVITGIEKILAGAAQVVLVVGAEQQKTMSVADGAEVLAGAGDYDRERPAYGQHMFPKLFAEIADKYADFYGIPPATLSGQLAAVAIKNRAGGVMNPLSQFRDKPLTRAEAENASEKNPLIAGLLKVSDCSPVSDGSAAVVLAGGAFTAKWGRQKAPRLAGYGQSTDRVLLKEKDAPVFSVARRAVDRALSMAGIGISDVSAAEVHDCFGITEIVATELLGLAPHGQGSAWIQSGGTLSPAVARRLGQPRPASEGKRIAVPVNPGGGLMGDGHPVGATGVRQVCEAFAHLTGTAGERQVEGASKYLTFNMGGSLTTSVCTVWEA
jgi:acetyl-CoA C-acetyltransferase